MDPLSKFPFFVILSIALWQIFQMPELPEHSPANVTYVMVFTYNLTTGREVAVWKVTRDFELVQLCYCACEGWLPLSGNDSKRYLSFFHRYQGVRFSPFITVVYKFNNLSMCIL